MFWVYERNRHFYDISWPSVTHPSMAANLPFLPGSPSVSRRVLTSFVPPAHIQGVSSAPLQGRALWTIFLPTTGSFVIIVCRLQHPSSSTFRWASPVGYLLLSSFFRYWSPAYGQNRIAGTCFSCPAPGASRSYMGLNLLLRLLRASGYPPSSSLGRRLPQSSGSDKISGSACMQRQSSTASFSGGSSPSSCNTDGSI